jgi:gamma-glutamylcyclotransferase (GGCT)/AIG2-like uncharacterized protein YtfP
VAAHLRRRGHQLGRRPGLGRGGRRERVFVVLYELHDLDEQVLDHWDGAHLGYFQKLRVRVQTLDGDEAAWLYVLNDYEGGLPSARYLGIVADAAELAGAPADYVAGLRARPCMSLGG